MFKTRIVAGVAAAILGGFVGTSIQAHAQAWPQRPVRLIIPFGPGAGADIGARLIQERLQGFPELEMDGNIGLFATKVVPATLIDRIAADVVAASRNDKTCCHATPSLKMARAGLPRP